MKRHSSLGRAKANGILIINFRYRIADPTIAKAFVGADDVMGAYKLVSSSVKDSAVKGVASWKVC